MKTVSDGVPEHFQNFDVVLEFKERSFVDLLYRLASSKVCGDFAEWFEGGFEVYENFLG